MLGRPGRREVDKPGAFPDDREMRLLPPAARAKGPSFAGRGPRGHLFVCLSLSTLVLASLAAPGLPRGGPLEEIALTPRERADLLRGTVIVRAVAEPGKPGKTFEAVGVLPCGLEEAFAVITDYRRYPEFMPRVAQAVVRDEKGPVAVVEIHLSLPLGQSRRYRLRYESARTEEGFVVAWRKVAWPELPANQTVKDTSGRWLVRRFDAGGLLASYRVSTDPGPVPLGLDGLAESLGKRSLADVIEKVKTGARTLFRPRTN